MYHIDHPVHNPVLDKCGNEAKLYVITPYINSVRYKSRYNLYQNFRRMVEKSGAILYTVEVAFGHRPFAVTECGNPRHIQLRTNSELWHKENQINLGVEKLPQDWEYMAFIDADIHFSRMDWVNETIHLLQHYDVIQMFKQAYDLDQNNNIINSHKGFVYSYLNSLCSGKDYSTWHPGYAWAIRREAFNSLGGLIDIAILGAADRHMAFALINRIEESIPLGLHPEYKKDLMIWQDRAEKYIKRNIGYMDGSLLHHWHGKKASRGYSSRWKILIQNQYQPSIDLKEDWQGLWQLTDRSIRLRDDIRRYMRSRCEDELYSEY